MISYKFKRVGLTILRKSEKIVKRKNGKTVLLDTQGRGGSRAMQY